MSNAQPTFGDLRFQLTKEIKNPDADLLDGWIADRYRMVLDRIPWANLDFQYDMDTTAPYATGTIAVTNGSMAIAVTGGSWNTSMTGLGIRIAAGNAFYQFAWLTATTGTIDRPYEGATDAAASYSIFQNVYALPSDLRSLRDVRSLDPPGKITRLSRGELDEIMPNRANVGPPSLYILHMNDAAVPANAQIEFYPIPDDVYPIAFWYTTDPAMFDANDTGVALPRWMRIHVLKDGVRASAAVWVRDFQSADRYEKQFRDGIQQMVLNDSRRTGSQQIHMNPHYSAHRRARVTR